jgi:hypothetical protein
VTTVHATAPVIARAPVEHAPAMPPFSAPGAGLARMPTVPSADPSGPSYDQISAQLKRDLLRQRERMGDLLGDLPWA